MIGSGALFLTAVCQWDTTTGKGHGKVTDVSSRSAQALRASATLSWHRSCLRLRIQNSRVSRSSGCTSTMPNGNHDPALHYGSYSLQVTSSEGGEVSELCAHSHRLKYFHTIRPRRIFCFILYLHPVRGLWCLLCFTTNLMELLCFRPEELTKLSACFLATRWTIGGSPSRLYRVIRCISVWLLVCAHIPPCVCVFRVLLLWTSEEARSQGSRKDRINPGGWSSLQFADVLSLFVSFCPHVSLSLHVIAHVINVKCWKIPATFMSLPKPLSSLVVQMLIVMVVFNQHWNNRQWCWRRYCSIPLL